MNKTSRAHQCLQRLRYKALLINTLTAMKKKQSRPRSQVGCFLCQLQHHIAAVNSTPNGTFNLEKHAAGRRQLWNTKNKMHFSFHAAFVLLRVDVIKTAQAERKKA